MSKVDTIELEANASFSTPLFVSSLLCLCLSEAFMIRGLWFRPQPPVHRLRGFDLPFLAWIPGLAAFMLKLAIRSRLRSGEITPSMAGYLDSGLSILVLVTYLLITRLAEIAFA